MDSGQLTALTSCHDVSQLTSCNIESGDIILMEWIVWEVLVSIFWLFLSSKEFLFPCLEILTNSESGSGENDFIVCLSKVKSVLVSVTSESVDVVDFIGDVWFGRIISSICWWLLLNLLQEELISLFLLGFCFFHVFL